MNTEWRALLDGASLYVVYELWRKLEHLRDYVLRQGFLIFFVCAIDPFGSVKKSTDPFLIKMYVRPYNRNSEIYWITASLV